MGDAKRRGTRAERVEQAESEQQRFTHFMADAVGRPVDENLFLYCSEIYAAAASMAMPTENPALKEIHIEDYGTVAFTDNPTNRGMLAVMKELREHGLDDRDRYSLTWRIMHFDDVLAQTERFARWFKPGDEEGTLHVSECLLRACARARIEVDGADGAFDLDDVERVAADIERRIERDDDLAQNGNSQ